GISTKATVAERMIPFVAAYVDAVDIAGKRITVDWQPDY
ncbi:MAG TPA: ribosome maturation factor RimM, partial [Polaromonas sp.]|nr:ribosome maturation factor RimM [Polaromonas sp.]